MYFIANIRLASCPWGPITANRVDLLTEIYTIYMEANTSHASAWDLNSNLPKIISVGPTAAAGEAVTDAEKESWEIYKDMMI